VHNLERIFVEREREREKDRERHIQVTWTYANDNDEIYESRFLSFQLKYIF